MTKELAREYFVEAIRNLDDQAIKDATTFITNKYAEVDDEGFLHIKWSLEDIIGIADQEGYSLTERQVRDIAGILVRCHDAEYGICWDTMRVTMSEYCEAEGIKSTLEED